MRVLLTGGAGYVGSVLLPKLLARGHQVRVIDAGYFGVGHLRAMLPAVDLIREDLRTIVYDPRRLRDVLDDCQCIIHLAAISNDPSAELVPELTHDVNYRATVTIAEAARASGKQFLFSSSCSVYGDGEHLLDESSPVAPLTAYARSKVDSEVALQELADGNWKPVILRNGTLFGYSPRMRFDLVVNIFSLQACSKNEIVVFGRGEQWRPFLHVDDCARAFVFFAERAEASGLIYNIAKENLRVCDVAEQFKLLKPGLAVVRTAQEDVDRRDYRVQNERMRAEGFEPRISVTMGIEEMFDAIISGAIMDPESIFYRNAKWLKQLTRGGIEQQNVILSMIEQGARFQFAFGP